MNTILEKLVAKEREIAEEKRILLGLLQSVAAREERLFSEVRRMEVIYPRQKRAG